MQRHMLKSKIHRATVTACDLHYVGSITVDAELLRAADILANEKVHVLDIDNGSRFETYTIEGEPGSGEMKVNGAAAHLVEVGHKIIVLSYGIYDQRGLDTYAPLVVHVDATNQPIRVDSHPEVLLTDAGEVSVVPGPSGSTGLWDSAEWDPIPSGGGGTSAGLL